MATEGDRWDARPEYAAYVLALAGLSAQTGADEHTRIGREEVWARVWIDKRGIYVVRLATKVRGRRSLCLTEIYAMQRAGSWLRLQRPEQARWQLAALVEAGIVEPTCAPPRPARRRPEGRRQPLGPYKPAAPAPTTTT